MLSLGPFAFAAPWLLLALPALPLLYWLLRVTPPAPKRVAFAPIFLLRLLPRLPETPARTPWWLLALRLLAAALIILGLARPVLGPGAAGTGQGTLLLVLDDGWASGADWPARLAALDAALRRAGHEGRPAALLTTAPGLGAEPPRLVGPMPATDMAARLAALRPKPWAPDRTAALAAFTTWRRANPGPLASLFVHDGLAHGGDAAAGNGPAGNAAAGDAPAAGAATGQALAEALAAAGPLTLAQDTARPARLLAPPVAEADRLRLTVLQAPHPRSGAASAPASVPARDSSVTVLARDSSVTVLARTGDGRTLARAQVPLPAGAAQGEATLDLPLELRNQVVRLEIENEPGAGSVQLLDERFRRRPLGLLPGSEEAADAPLIGDLFYLSRAMQPYAEIRRGTVEELLKRPIAVLALADRPVAEGAEREALTRWVQQGGTLLRFAGPRVAEKPDSLLPVPLRAERQLGGALSWEQPQRLAPFPATSPFAGLAVPEDVTVERQVLAEPSPRLTERTWARLSDGTPLVTAEARGAGRVVLFHVTATADWSNLPLSGLFVQMLRRIVALSAGINGAEGEQPLAPLESLDGFGRLAAPPPAAAALVPAELARTAPGPRHPPGWYGQPGEGGYRRALNLGGSIAPPAAAAAPPPGTTLLGIGGVPAEQDLGPWLLALALLLLAADMLLSLRLRGLLAGRAVAAALLLWALAQPAAAQAPAAEASPALATRLAYVASGDSQLDDVLRAGLIGLSDYVNRRTNAALAEPVAVVPGQSDLAFFPLLYWVVTAEAAPPDAAAVAALNGFMRQGGIILFDTRDEGSGEGFAAGARPALRRVTRDLAIPPLALIGDDHVLRRSFYLLPELPGRFAGGQVWVSREQDRANDSVSPVIIGGHDWASAWAVDEAGNNPYATTPGGARQRTLAYRFGVNLVMYALTGNYKGDQVHVPQILERLGN